MSAIRLVRPFVAALVSVAVSLAAAPAAQAGGLFLPTRGVRASARGGAFVAGGDDLGVLWYNPAGLTALAGGKQKRALLVDLTLVSHPVTYTRIDSGGNPQAAVENDPQALPLPTLAAGFDLGKDWVLAVGLFTPTASLDGYPELGAQRYSLVSLHHTVLLYGAVGLAWQFTEKLSLGASVSNLFMSFNSLVVFSSCPGETICQPENPEFDALGQLEQTDLFNPSGALGLQYKASKQVRLGLSFQLPYAIHSTGKLRVRMPSSGFFAGAHVEGEDGSMDMTLPGALRGGVELRPGRDWRIELGFDWEMWSQHDEIVLTPDNIFIEDQAGVGLYEIGELVIPRKLEDTVAIMLGIEGQPVPGVPLALRGGYVYESGAAPDEYLSVLTPDGGKHIFSFGLGYTWGKVRVDAVVAHAAVDDRKVDVDETCVPQLNPIRTGEDPTEAGAACVHDGAPEHVYVGAGTYSSSWTTFGLGMNMDF